LNILWYTSGCTWILANIMWQFYMFYDYAYFMFFQARWVRSSDWMRLRKDSQKNLKDISNHWLNPPTLHSYGMVPSWLSWLIPGEKILSST
jgi:hypothetical protein